MLARTIPGPCGPRKKKNIGKAGRREKRVLLVLVLVLVLLVLLVLPWCWLLAMAMTTAAAGVGVGASVCVAGDGVSVGEQPGIFIRLVRIFNQRGIFMWLSHLHSKILQDFVLVH